MMETMEFTTVYDDVTTRSLDSEFARLAGEVFDEERGEEDSPFCESRFCQLIQLD